MNRMRASQSKPRTELVCASCGTEFDTIAELEQHEFGCGAAEQLDTENQNEQFDEQDL